MSSVQGEPDVRRSAVYFLHNYHGQGPFPGFSAFPPPRQRAQG